MAESEDVENPKNPDKPKKVGHIKMVVLPDLKSKTITPIAEESIDGEASVISDGTKSHVKFPEKFKEYIGRVINPEEIGKVLPWVHVAIANAKTRLANIYHGIKPEFLQGYLNEFCYKFNRRYFGERLFDRMLVAATSYPPSFKSRVYNSNIATA